MRLAEGTEQEARWLASYERAGPPEQSRRAAELVRRRLSTPHDAQGRNSHNALNDENFERFFGYPPSQRTSGAR